MSEYQYYEFQALDHPMTSEARADMKRLSSRVQLTASSASFVYHYGDFRGDPFAILAEQFDAMLYITNWGTRQVMFRLPAALIPASMMQHYQYADYLEWTSAGEHLILNIQFTDEDGGREWIEGEGWLSRIAPLRADILRGDQSALYLAWLVIAHYESEFLEDDEDLTEPPVPPGLQELSPALESLIDFFAIDPDLVTAAAQASPTADSGDIDLHLLIDRLPTTEQHDFLARLLRGESHLDIVLANRLREIGGAPTDRPAQAERRTIRALVAAVEQVRELRLAAESQQREAARLKHLEQVGQRESSLWAEIPQLVEQRNSHAYDDAVKILKDLQALAVHQRRTNEFQTRLATICQQYPTLRGFHTRLKDAGLAPKG